MFYAISWSVTFILLALWSLAAWAFHSLATWALPQAGVLAGDSPALEGLQAPDWLAPWLPPDLAGAITSMQSAVGPVVDAALGYAPALAGGLSVAVWVTWGIGCALIVVLGLACSRLITALRVRTSLNAGPSRRAAAAG